METYNFELYRNGNLYKTLSMDKEKSNSFIKKLKNTINEYTCVWVYNNASEFPVRILSSYDFNEAEL